MLEGPESDTPEHPVFRLLLQPKLRDEMPKGHVRAAGARAAGGVNSYLFGELLLPAGGCCLNVARCVKRWHRLALTEEPADPQVFPRGSPAN